MRGELKVQVLTDDPHRFGKLERVFVGPDGEDAVAWAVSSYRVHKEHVLLKLEGCDDRNTAEGFRGLLVQIPIEAPVPLEEGEYYEHQIVGLEVWTSAGEYLGRVEEILYTGANEVYVVHDAKLDRGEILIPAIADVVLEVDLEAGRLEVDLMEGLA
ncbi:MAG: ribosome maturation factor RimM [Anaerolineae bacterium]|nr:ribosome maturation factor RimM [Anaerolineae bacterium]